MVLLYHIGIIQGEFNNYTLDVLKLTTTLETIPT